MKKTISVLVVVAFASGCSGTLPEPGLARSLLGDMGSLGNLNFGD